MMDFRIPSALSRAEFVCARFHLEFQEPVRLTPEVALRLRRDLRRAGRPLLDMPQGEDRFAALFDPPLSSDPVALKHYQKPGPLFVLQPLSGLPRILEPGDGIDMEVTFWGRGMQVLGDFIAVLQELGRIGLHKGEGRFEVIRAEAADPSGQWQGFWTSHGKHPLAPPVTDCRWWIENRGPSSEVLHLEFLTPARLLSGGRPLFQPRFPDIFPFILRRVASMLHTCCGLEVVDDPAPLLDAARHTRERKNALSWQDWRTLAGDRCHQDLGGLLGNLAVDTEGLENIYWIVVLGSLLGVGKGASFANGHYRLTFSPDSL